MVNKYSIDKTRQDNRSSQPKECQVVVLGQMDNTLDHTFESANRVYDKNQLCPTIPTCAGGNIQPKVIEETRCVGGLSDQTWGKQYHQQDRVYKGDIALAQPANLPEGSYKYVMEELKIKQATKEGIIKCKVGGYYDASYPDSKTRMGRVQDNGDTVPTLTASSSENINYVETVYRIRKLTPKECFRLMSFRDEDFEAASKVNSNSQLYKQSGNSICECVLKAIFSQMGIKGIPRWNDTH